LFPAAVLGMQRLLRSMGAADGPLTWQWAGQSASLLAGIAVVAATGFLAWRLAAVLNLSGAVHADPRAVSLWAMLLATLLPLNTWLSADVMSDQLHLAFFLSASAFLVDVRRSGMAAIAGVLGGLAYLTRPEGASIILAGVAILCARSLRERSIRGLPLAAMLILSFTAAAAPYVIYIGGISPKIDKPVVDAAAAGAEPSQVQPSVSALIREEVSWWQAASLAAYHAIRGGRVLLPAVCLAVLFVHRRQLLREPLSLPVACMLLFFVMLVILQKRHGYLDPRHALTLIALMTPFSALGLAFLSSWSRGALLRKWLVLSLGVTIIASLAVYAARVPNGADGFVPEAVAWLRQYDPELSRRTFMGGSSERRIAFYAGAAYTQWPEHLPEGPERLAELSGYLFGGRPDYFLIETGPSPELRPNATTLEKLMAMAGAPAQLEEIKRFATGRDKRNRLLVFRLRS
jgi:hypothetical protein